MSWTGGQYSLYRVLLGCWLIIFIASGISNQPSWYSAVGCLASVSLLLGLFDRLAAVVLCLLLAYFLGQPERIYLCAVLLYHAATPPAPYLSWAARKRDDPGGNWHLPKTLYSAVWALVAVLYCYSGWCRLQDPNWLSGSILSSQFAGLLEHTGIANIPAVGLDTLAQTTAYGVIAFEVFFLPLLLVARLRPWVWLLLLVVETALGALAGGSSLAAGVFFLHLLTFWPGWVPRKFPDAHEVVFYDGNCALCHRAVRFLLAEDRYDAFQFAPLDGKAFELRIPQQQRAKLPDSVIVKTRGGRILSESEAVLYIQDRLGGIWRLLALFERLLPGLLRDLLYRAVAKTRYLLWGRSKDVCPLISEEQAKRFLFDS